MENSKVCARHGNTAIKSFPLAILNKTFHLCQTCINEDNENTKNCEPESKAGKEQRCINNHLHNAMMSPRFLDKRLDNYNATTAKHEKALKASWWLINNMDKTTGLIFLGGTGTGKNHLACGIVHEVVKQDKTALITTAMKVVRSIKDSWRDSKQKEADMILSYTKPDLLVIDEIGVQFGSETETLYISEIINDRYEAMKPSILIGNVKLDEFKSQMGDRVVDRFREGGKLIIFDWESYRGLKK